MTDSAMLAEILTRVTAIEAHLAMRKKPRTKRPTVPDVALVHGLGGVLGGSFTCGALWIDGHVAILKLRDLFDAQQIGTANALGRRLRRLVGVDCNGLIVTEGGRDGLGTHWEIHRK